jgi:aspartate-semialdehyde dehydrogenase
MSSSLSIAVAGSTGAVGQEVVKVLDQVRWRPETLLAAASSKTATPFVEYGEDRVAVEDAEHLDLGRADALIVATPVGCARALVERAVEEGVFVIDLSGAMAEDADVPRIIPWVNPERLAEVGARQVVACPSAPALMLASVLGPLVRSGLSGRIHATVFVPASSFGRAGIDELSRQVVALFNAGTPPRKVFPQGLAFDLLPAIGVIDEDGWAAQERSVATEVVSVVGPAFELTVSLVGTPLFSGMCADVTLDLARQVPADLVKRILTDGGVRMLESESARNLPRPRRVEGEAFVHVARVRSSASDPGRVQLWAAVDNLRASASCAVSLAGALLRDRLRDSSE